MVRLLLRMILRYSYDINLLNESTNLKVESTFFPLSYNQGKLPKFYKFEVPL